MNQFRLRMRWIRQNGRLRRLERWLEGPMVVLAFVWIALLIIEFAGGEARWLDRASNVIWAIFVGDFALRFALARGKLLYVRQNWLTLVSLALPALRVFRLTRGAAAGSRHARASVVAADDFGQAACAP